MSKKRIIEGWLYVCGWYECNGAFILKRRLTRADIDEDYLRSKPKEEREELEKHVEKVLGGEGGYIWCPLAHFCLDERLQEVVKANLLEELVRFSGRKVRITIEVIGD